MRIKITDQAKIAFENQCEAAINNEKELAERLYAFEKMVSEGEQHSKSTSSVLCVFVVAMRHRTVKDMPTCDLVHCRSENGKLIWTGIHQGKLPEQANHTAKK